jgi:hypothetical protein
VNCAQRRRVRISLTAPTDALTANVCSEQRAEAIPPKAHGLVAQVDAALEKQILDVAQRQRKPDIHQDDKADDLGR